MPMDSDFLHSGQWFNLQNSKWRKDGNVLFNDTLNTFYLWLYLNGVRHMIKDHSDSEERKPAAAIWATLSD